jgi:hypothetical protein
MQVTIDPVGLITLNPDYAARRAIVLGAVIALRQEFDQANTYLSMIEDMIKSLVPHDLSPEGAPPGASR